MNKRDLIQLAASFVENSKGNYISEANAISESVIGMKIYDEPVFAFGFAEDKYFLKLKNQQAIGEHFMHPKEWLPKAKTVISFFLPFTDTVKEGNKKDRQWPSEEWLHGRIEGQAFLSELCLHLKMYLIRAGYESVVPSLDARFWSRTKVDNSSQYSYGSFTSNWSERHVAFVCGLGTFGLSKGLITEKGISGRFGSIVTAADFIPDIRPYNDIYEYCSMCGICAENCPAGAISIENGKDHAACAEFLNITAEKYKPRYGCGKCQVCVPCESGIPKANE